MEYKSADGYPLDKGDLVYVYPADSRIGGLIKEVRIQDFEGKNLMYDLTYKPDDLDGHIGCHLRIAYKHKWSAEQIQYRDRLQEQLENLEEALRKVSEKLESLFYKVELYLEKQERKIE